MKLATFRIEDRQTFGPLTEGGVVDLPATWPEGPADLLMAIRQGSDTLDRIAGKARNADPIPLDKVRLLAPLPAPPKLLGIAVNYVEHHNELERMASLPDNPRVHTTPRPFLMPTTAVTNPGEEIPWPAFSEDLDHEIELAVVIGRRTRCVSPGEALDCVAGYTLANDISARSVTHNAGRTDRPKDVFFDWLHGKWGDGFCPLGPVLVTAEDIPAPQDLTLELTVNGETRQKASTSLMIFPVAELVSFCSHLMTLTPGDVIATGTPSGVGKATGKLLAPGDEVSCFCEPIGRLTNTVGPRPERFYTPCQR
jgi:2-keto-4-pentenoate hydratase/2-oxohepta-3-ene-1,7-dioic acid hydratase in catechol pathway